MIPITKSETPSRYYIINTKKKIRFKTKLARFLVRYLIPLIIIVSAIIVSDVMILNRINFEDITIETVKFGLLLLILSIVAVFLSSLWFKFITKNQDER